MPITVALRNDYPLVVAGLSAVLAPYAGRVHVAELDVGLSVLSRVDVVLQDTYASAPGSVPVSRSATGPGAPKRVLYTWNSNPDLVRAALQNDVDGYILKSTTPDELVQALEWIYYFAEPIYPEKNDHAAWPPVGRWPGDHHGLSSRESEVLALICQGLSNLEISQRAYLSVNTVKTYIRSAYRKIGATTRPQAVIWGHSHGLAKPAGERTIL